ncbi:4Fe-4S binding protein [Pyrobaculum sp. 3827-6]|uniref:4Fe-4S binding protein n=1 Tax=Pyrobaculum sp. 3827-6 TaxID=2983604 RepID=UPI0021D82BBB|nr:4Fe-4S binding protein [Pyrobaculum sp. 3827-6]MCU7788257.1 4Fe-4S binding protein [Pyrobaculum sp. 3827-6]
MKIYADFSRCVRSFWKASNCSKCVEACPAGALHIGDGRVEVAEDLCVGCGICIGACPTGVYTPAEEIGPRISCREGGPCIHALRFEDYVKLVEKYGEVEVDARCDDCKLRDAGGGWRALEEALKAGLKVKVVRGRGGDVSRRLLFRRAAAGEPLIKAVRGPPRRFEYSRPLGTEGLRPVVDADRCVLCGVCAGVCPTEAVKVDEESGLVTVDGGRCVECGVCVEACDVGALRLERGEVDVEHYLVEVVQCPNCGTVYAKNRGECPVCGFTTKLIKELYGL